MKNFIFCCFSIIIISNSFAQKYNYDSLQKYSYLIWGAKVSNRPFKGTGFFIRYKTNLYLISANHVITGYNSLKKYTPVDYPDVLNIRVNKDLFFTLPVLSYKKEVKDFSFYLNPDLSIIKINEMDSSGIKIYSIEKFVSSYDTLTSFSIDRIILYGYSEELPEREDSLLKVDPSLHEAKIFTDYRNSVFITDQKLYDTINYYGEMVSTNREDGASGSPAFFVLKNKEIIFGGLYFATMDKNRLGVFIRPETILKYLKNYKD